MEAIEILGILSALLILAGFIANEYGRLSSGSLWYDLLNFIGAIGLFVYAYTQGVVPFMLTNGVWAFVSGVDVIRYLLGRKRLKSRRK